MKSKMAIEIDKGEGVVPFLCFYMTKGEGTTFLISYYWCKDAFLDLWLILAC